MRSLLASLLLLSLGCAGGEYTGDPTSGGAGDSDGTTAPPDDPGADDPGADDPTDASPPPPAGRVTEGLAALYEFNEGIGPSIRDTSGVGTALNLTVASPGLTTWTPTGLRIDASTIIRSNAPATKIISACKASNEITVEAWVTPASVTTNNQPARIAGVSLDQQTRNFSLIQQDNDYSFRLRTQTTDLNGNPATSAPDLVTTSAQHVVYTRTAAGDAKIYIDNVEKATLATTDTFANWDDNYEFALANELTLDRPWLGTYHLVAVYCRALTPDEIRRNFDQRY